MKTVAIASIASAAALLAASAAVAASKPDPNKASATILSTTGAPIGSAVFRQTKSGVEITLSVKGLSPGEHAVHIHAVGKCDPAAKFSSAGGHFNPTMKDHGSMSANPEHAGDMPNQTVGADGTLNVKPMNPMVTLGSGETSVFDADGSAIVIHALADDYKSQPSGNAGDRVGCGVIVKNS